MKKDFVSRGRSVSDLKAHLVFEALLDKWEVTISTLRKYIESQDKPIN